VDRRAKKGAGFPVSDGELRLEKAAESANGDKVPRPPDRLGIDQHRHCRRCLLGKDKDVIAEEVAFRKDPPISELGAVGKNGCDLSFGASLQNTVAYGHVR
jgi:hypothetical protein